MYLVLVNHLEALSLSMNSVVRLTDSSDMTMDVKQQNNNRHMTLWICPTGGVSIVTCKSETCIALLVSVAV